MQNSATTLNTTTNTRMHSPTAKTTRTRTAADGSQLAEVRWLSGGRLVVPSRTTPGVEYVTDSEGGCSCPRGYRSCWHKTHRKQLREDLLNALKATGYTERQIVIVMRHKFPEITR